MEALYIVASVRLPMRRLGSQSRLLRTNQGTMTRMAKTVMSVSRHGDSASAMLQIEE